MHYPLVVFGVKDTSAEIISYIHKELMPVSLIVTIEEAVTKKNDVAGFQGLGVLEETLGIPVFEAPSYSLTDEKTAAFFADNTFELGIVSGWQRLIPKAVLDAFSVGIFGFHGNAGYLPFGRGRSPLNWSILLGDTRFNLNLFRYDEKPDSPNVFATRTFALNAHDTIRTAQYKNTIASKALLKELLAAFAKDGKITVRTDARDFDSWYEKRTPADGKIDFHGRTRDIYNLIRAVGEPFAGAFCSSNEHTVRILEAHPIDEILDFSAYAPGEIIEVFDDKPIVRTVDGSLLIDRYEADIPLLPGMVLS